MKNHKKRQAFAAIHRPSGALTSTEASTSIPKDTRTREESAADRRADLVKELESEVDIAQSKIDDFLKLVQDGNRDHLALFEEIGLVDAAARVRINKSVLDMLRQNVAMDELRAFVMNEVVRGAMYPSTSSSPAMNTARTLQTAAWAHVADRVRWLCYYGSLTNVVPGEDILDEMLTSLENKTGEPSDVALPATLLTALADDE